MLSIQVSINGIPIVVVNGYREATPLVARETEDTAYFYRYSGATMSADMKSEPLAYAGLVKHCYDDGLAKLAQVILTDIVKKTRKH